MEIIGIFVFAFASACVACLIYDFAIKDQDDTEQKHETTEQEVTVQEVTEQVQEITKQNPEVEEQVWTVPEVQEQVSEVPEQAWTVPEVTVSEVPEQMKTN